MNKIAIVDDDIIYREILLYYLKNTLKKKNVDVFDNIMSLLDSEKDYDLIVLDLFMGKEKSIDSLEDIKSTYPNSDYIIITASKNYGHLVDSGLTVICKDNNFIETFGNYCK